VLLSSSTALFLLSGPAEHHLQRLNLKVSAYTQSCPLELDHVFIIVPPSRNSNEFGELSLDENAAKESQAQAGSIACSLNEAGLLESFSRVHQGQGTANHRYQFDNILVELLYIHNASELSIPPSTALQLEARFAAPDASPFGFCSRPEGACPDGTSDASYPHALYKPSYLPPNFAVQFCDGLPPSEPLWFHLPFASKPDAESEADRAHPCGLRQLKSLRLEVSRPLWKRSSEIAEQLQIDIIKSERHHLHLHFETSASDRAGRSLEPHPALPLSLHW